MTETPVLFPIHTGRLMVLILYRYCLGCEIVSAAACHVQKRLSQQSSPTLAFKSFFLFFWNIPWGVVVVELRICDLNFPFIVEHSTDTCPLNFGQLWISILTTIPCTEKFLWWRLRGALIYGYMIPCPFSKLVASLLLGPISSPIHGLLVRFTILGMSFFLRIWP